MKSSSGEHFLGLDHVRALAAFMVFSWHFIHASVGYPVPFASAPAIFPLSVFDEGHTGVSLFMTLSGYLFAKLLDGKDIHFPSFLWNRFVRLAPLMVLVVAVSGGIDVAQGAPAIEKLLFFIKGLVLPTLPNGPWSVTVEAHFYLILPLLLAAFRKSNLTAVAILAVSIATRLALYAHFGEIQSLSYWTIVGRIDQFVLGIAAFRCCGLMNGRHGAAAGVALGFFGFYWLFDSAGGFYKMPAYPSPSPIWIIMPAIEGAAYAFLIAYYDRNFTPRNRGLSWLIGLAGSYSYSIYLLHFVVVFRAASFINHNVMDLSNFYVAQAWAVFCFALMIPVGYLSFRFVEQPFLKFRVRYTPSPQVVAGRLVEEQALS